MWACELAPSLPEEQPVLLTAEPSLQPHNVLFNYMHILAELNKSHSLNSLAGVQEITIIIGVTTLVILENSMFHLENS